jgi:hypothetical protein
MLNDVFISKAIKIHGDKYDYSLVDYKNNHTNIQIKCSKHGVFEQSPNSHLRKRGCPTCGRINMGLKKRNTLNNFIEQAKSIHGDKYNYSLVEYVSNYTKVKIICPKHGVFEQKPNSHITGKSGCLICSGKYKSDKNFFIEKSKKIHDSFYDYSLVDYKNNNIKVKIICPKHGVFEQKPNNHLSGQNCPICRNSKGELEIKKWLEKNNIIHIQQHKFDGCMFKRHLKFDFYIPEYNMCIEYDGKQHYEIIEHWGGEESLFKIQMRDLIKDEYCRCNNIKLIRFKFSDDMEMIYTTLKENLENKLS